ncbi:MAG: sigma-70 family RNA polymerase sigma factor [Patescibacteria group bacterium]|nr:sigma-70 family RNA polymerase sigma factor [Patescibacteria group bacterium]
MLDGDQKIINSAISGKASAFGLLYDKYHAQIYRFIYLKVSHREEAEDLTHQVFLNAWQNIKKYEFKGFPFSSWLYQIARNQVIDHYRTKKSNIDIEDIKEIKNDDDTLDNQVNRNYEIEKVKNVIQNLNPEHQDIIIMKFVEELTSQEISKILNKPQSTIRVIQHRAVKNLRNMLKKENKNGQKKQIK